MDRLIKRQRPIESRTTTFAEKENGLCTAMNLPFVKNYPNISIPQTEVSI
jgi:hypothetical protein